MTGSEDDKENEWVPMSRGGDGNYSPGDEGELDPNESYFHGMKNRYDDPSLSEVARDIGLITLGGGACVFGYGKVADIVGGSNIPDFEMPMAYEIAVNPENVETAAQWTSEILSSLG